MDDCGPKFFSCLGRGPRFNDEIFFSVAVAFVLGLYGDDGKIVKNDLGGERFFFASEFFFLGVERGRKVATYVRDVLSGFDGWDGKGVLFFFALEFFFLGVERGRKVATYVRDVLSRFDGWDGLYNKSLRLTLTVM